tara:strand:- start:457 stop:663 length:207 start_codon:yes stop_codon:yes gene_type:complete
MNKEGSLDGVAITSSKVDKEFNLRGSGGNKINLPHFFFDHLEWKINQPIDVSIVEGNDETFSILIEKR